MLLTIFLATVGILSAIAVYRAYPSKTDKTVKTTQLITRIIFIPLWAVIVYASVAAGGATGMAIALIVSFLATLWIVVIGSDVWGDGPTQIRGG